MNDDDGMAYIDGPGLGWMDPPDEEPTEEIAVTCEYCRVRFECLRAAERHECPSDKEAA